MSYEFFIARRYLRSKRKTGFISLITIFSMGGILIGVAALIITFAIMNGYESELRAKIVGFDAHIRLRQFHGKPGFENYPGVMEQLMQINHVVACAPYIIEQGIIQSRKVKPQPIIIKGSDAEAEKHVSNIDNYMVEGELNLGITMSETGSELPGVVLGKRVAEQMKVGPSDVVFMYSPEGILEFGGGFQPKINMFRVTGIFESGLDEFDSKIAIMGIPQARDFFQYGDKIGGIEIRLDSYEIADPVAYDIRNLYPYPATTETWYERNRPLFAWLQNQRWASSIVLSLIIFVAAFNIISTLIMVVMEKRKDIGVLKSLGASSGNIMKIFLFHGVVVGTIGTILGCIVGYGLCWSQLKFRWFSLPADIYFINSLPIEMHVLDFVLISVIALLLSIFAGIYPAWHASRLDPVVVIRYN
ncbi:FtsX-like permease family protein [candidate division KSB1 bacterium]|nr:FtsX-like permease family protein [candidate division KSB1 bacterium]